jgi:outer membrane protein assembly factor BamC
LNSLKGQSRMLFPRVLVIVVLASALTQSCSWLGASEDAYLQAGSVSRTKIPESLDEPIYDDAMAIPPIDDARGIAGQKLELGLPEALSTAFGVEQIVIKRIGDNRWVFIDTPPAAVWPRIRQFWEAHNLEVQTADPRRGIIESTWLASREGEADVVYQSLVSGVAWADPGATVQNKFRLTIEPGIRNGSCEVFVEHKQVPLGAPVRQDTANWNGGSDDELLENKVLTEMAYFLGENINQSITVSREAMNIRGTRAEIIPDKEKPILKYKLSFDRAWATVTDALENARISVDDLDRDSAIFYVLYDDTIKAEPGFFSKMFASDDEKDQKPGFFGKLFSSDKDPVLAANRYLLMLEEHDKEVFVTVRKDADTLADPFLAERLLKIIKEYSS